MSAAASVCDGRPNGHTHFTRAQQQRFSGHEFVRELSAPATTAQIEALAPTGSAVEAGPLSSIKVVKGSALYNTIIDRVATISTFRKGTWTPRMVPAEWPGGMLVPPRDPFALGGSGVSQLVAQHHPILYWFPEAFYPNMMPAGVQCPHCKVGPAARAPKACNTQVGTVRVIHCVGDNQLFVVGRYTCSNKDCPFFRKRTKENAELESTHIARKAEHEAAMQKFTADSAAFKKLGAKAKGTTAKPAKPPTFKSFVERVTPAQFYSTHPGVIELYPPFIRAKWDSLIYQSASGKGAIFSRELLNLTTELPCAHQGLAAALERMKKDEYLRTCLLYAHFHRTKKGMPAPMKPAVTPVDFAPRSKFAASILTSNRTAAAAAADAASSSSSSSSAAAPSSRAAAPFGGAFATFKVVPRVRKPAAVLVPVPCLPAFATGWLGSSPSAFMLGSAVQSEFDEVTEVGYMRVMADTVPQAGFPFLALDATFFVVKMSIQSTDDDIDDVKVLAEIMTPHGEVAWFGFLTSESWSEFELAFTQLKARGFKPEIVWSDTCCMGGDQEHHPLMAIFDTLRLVCKDSFHQLQLILRATRDHHQRRTDFARALSEIYLLPHLPDVEKVAAMLVRMKKAGNKKEARAMAQTQTYRPLVRRMPSAIGPLVKNLAELFRRFKGDEGKDDSNVPLFYATMTTAIETAQKHARKGCNSPNLPISQLFYQRGKRLGLPIWMATSGTGSLEGLHRIINSDVRKTGGRKGHNGVHRRTTVVCAARTLRTRDKPR